MGGVCSIYAGDERWTKYFNRGTGGKGITFKT
jgi:hypothetical protein